MLLPPAAHADDSSNFIASIFDQQGVDLTDGSISPGWENVTYYQMIPEFGENGLVKFANNATHLFSLFVVESNLQWAAIEFEAWDGLCMVDGNDGWTFYIDQNTAAVTVHDEVYKGSAGPPTHDTTNNLQTEVVVDDTPGYHTIEIVRQLDTGDTQDIAYHDGDLIDIKFASSTHHSKGGLSNPTQFGPSDIFFLSVQTTGGDIIVPDTPNRIDYDFWKMIALIMVFFLAFGFMFLHSLIRQYFKPLDHPNPIVSADYVKPTLKYRWETTFGNGKHNGKHNGKTKLESDDKSDLIKEAN